MSSDNSELVRARRGRSKPRRYCPHCAAAQAGEKLAFVGLGRQSSDDFYTAKNDRQTKWWSKTEGDLAVVIENQLAAESGLAGWREIYDEGQVLDALRVDDSGTRSVHRKRSFQGIAPLHWEPSNLAEFLGSRPSLFNLWRAKGQPTKRASKKHLADQFRKGCEAADWRFKDVVAAAEAHRLGLIAEVLRIDRATAALARAEVLALNHAVQAAIDGTIERERPRKKLFVFTAGSGPARPLSWVDAEDANTASSEEESASEAIDAFSDNDVLFMEKHQSNYVRYAVRHGQRISAFGKDTGPNNKFKSCPHTMKKSHRGSGWAAKPRFDVKGRRARVRAAGSSGLRGPEDLL